MALMIHGGRIPSRLAERCNSCSLVSPDGHTGPAECATIALINNMPDAALEDTELQFFDLLDAAAEDTSVCLKLYSLTGVPRTDRGQRHLNSFYYGIEDLWNHRFDGVIITGTEPRQPNLRNEPYWPALADVFDWAERNTHSTILSCLAAHAGVLHSDNIERHPLPDKQFGVFDFGRVADHPLIANAADTVRFPHSRWNEVEEHKLTACGYDVLTRSEHAGVDCFVKKKRNSLFVHFQGHPEYGASTLLKEYRRDVRRFLNHERETYPTMPYGYFDAAAAEKLDQFRQEALSDRCVERMDSFPDACVGTPQSTWRSSAVGIYRKWLQYLLSRKADTSTSVVFATNFASEEKDRPYGDNGAVLLKDRIKEGVPGNNRVERSVFYCFRCLRRSDVHKIHLVCVHSVKREVPSHIKFGDSSLRQPHRPAFQVRDGIDPPVLPGHEKHVLEFVRCRNSGEVIALGDTIYHDKLGHQADIHVAFRQAADRCPPGIVFPEGDVEPVLFKEVLVLGNINERRSFEGRPTDRKRDSLLRTRRGGTGIQRCKKYNNRKCDDEDTGSEWGLLHRYAPGCRRKYAAALRVGC